MGGSSKPQTQTTNTNQNQTQSATPWGPAAPLLSGLLQETGNAYAATPKTPTYTGPNADQLTAQDALRAFAPQSGAGAASLLANAQKTAGGYYLDPANNRFLADQNPNIDAFIAASIDPLRKQLDQNVLSIGDAAKLAGAYGGDRQDLLKGTALTGFNQAAMNTAGTIRYGAWNDAEARAQQAQQFERTQQMNASQLFAQANASAMTPAQIMAALGDTEAQQQLAINQSKLDAPWAGLDRVGQVLGVAQPYATTNTVGTGTSTTTGTPAKGSQLSGGISGALGGASAGASFGPWGAGIGAVLGGLGGLFG